MRLLSARSGVRIPPSTPSCELSPYIRAFFLFIDSFENLFENLYKKNKETLRLFVTNALELIKYKLFTNHWFAIFIK